MTNQARGSMRQRGTLVTAPGVIPVSSTPPNNPALGALWVDPTVDPSPVNVLWYGAKGDGTTDDTAALQAAISHIAAIPVNPVSGAFYQKPQLYLPAGVYRITAPFATILFRGLCVVGDGANNTAIYYDSTTDAPVFDIGTFSATPADIFAGVQGAEFRGIRIQANDAGAGSRKAQGIRASGGGSLRLYDVTVHGFKYGINSPYGGDFNTYTDVLAEYCDVGVYQGPGGQQFITTNLNVFGCVEGVVLDRWGHAHFTMPTFNSCATSGLVLEALTDTSTRQLTSFPSSGVSYQSKLVLDTPWMEGNAGSLGDNYVPTQFIRVNNSGSDAYRDVIINDPYILAGTNGGAAKKTTAFAVNSSPGLQRLVVNRPVFFGVMTQWFTTPTGSWELIDLRITAGYTAPALSGNLTGNVGRVDDTMSGGSGDNKTTVAALPRRETSEQADGSHGVATEHQVNGWLRWGFLNAGSYLFRLGLDIQNTRFVLGDPTQANQVQIGKASAQPTTGGWGAGSFVYNTAPSIAAGKVLIGWLRLTTGNTHVAGTDWTPVFGTTS